MDFVPVVSRSRYYLYEAINHYNGVKGSHEKPLASLSSPYSEGFNLSFRLVGLSFSF
jgi:hypothetical protein